MEHNKEKNSKEFFNWSKISTDNKKIFIINDTPEYTDWCDDAVQNGKLIKGTGDPYDMMRSQFIANMVIYNLEQDFIKKENTKAFYTKVASISGLVIIWIAWIISKI